MSRPSEQTIKRLFALSGNLCAFPGCSLPIVEVVGTVTGEICHIHAQNKGGPRYDELQSEEERQGFDNLILLCRRHHVMVDAEPDIYSADALAEIKRIRADESGRTEQPTDAFYAKILLGAFGRVAINGNRGNIIIDSPGAIQASTVHVKSPGRTIKIQPANGTIGADQDASRYVEHLISRYNEFAAADKSRSTKLNYGAISKNIETIFRARWKLLAMEEFDGVCVYLQTRISRTRVAKSNLAKGIKLFSSYHEFLESRQR
jgi:hypothetical protein